MSWIPILACFLAQAAGAVAEFAGKLETASPADIPDLVAREREGAAAWSRAEWAAFVRERASAGAEKGAPRETALAVAAALAERFGESHHAARLALAAAWSREEAARAARAQELWSAGEAAARRGEFARAEGAWAEAFGIARELGDGSEAGRILLARAALAGREGAAERSRGFIEEAALAFEGASDRPGLGAAAVALARLLVSSDLEGAAAAYRRAVAAYEAVRDERRARAALEALERSLADLGADRAESGELREALAAFREAEAAARKLGSPDARSRTAANLGSLALLQGNAEEAIRAYGEALAAESERPGGGDPVRKATVLANLGRAYREREDFGAAVREYGRALEILEPLEGREALRARADALFKLAAALRLRGEREEAERRRGEAFALARDLGDRRLLAGLHDLRGNLLEDEGRHAEAEREHRAALAIASEMRDPLARARTLTSLGEAILGQGRRAEALPLLREAAEILERERLRATAREESERFLRGREHPYGNLIRLLLEERASEARADRREELLAEAFAWAERCRARDLVRVLAEARSEIRRALPADLAREEREAFRRVSGIQARLRSAVARGAEGTALDALEAELASAEKGLRRVQERVWAERPGAAALEGPAAPGLGELAGAVLARDEALLLYALGEDASYLFAVRSGRAEAFALPRREALEAEIRPLVRALASPSAEVARVRDLARGAWETLVAPARETVGSARRLVVSPDGLLHALPFEVLVEPAGGGRPAYLVETRSVLYVPSAAVLAELRKRPRASRAASLLAVSDPRAGEGELAVLRGAAGREGLRELLGADLEPLANAAREVRAIERWFPKGGRTVLEGSAAREKALKDPAVLGRAAALHVAAHAVVSEASPATSALLLAPEPDGSEDGLFEVREALALSRVPDLVVLSACRTGVGELAGPEGVAGFARAFLVAGAGDVVVALWSVHDAAALAIVPEFYRELLEGGKPADEALRAAKLAYLAKGYRGLEKALKEESPERGPLSTTPRRAADPRDPFYWAPCVVVGRGGRLGGAPGEGGKP